MEFFGNFDQLSDSAQSFVLEHGLLNQINRANAHLHSGEFVQRYLDNNHRLTDSDRFYIHLYILNYNPEELPIEIVDLLTNQLRHIDLQQTAQSLHVDDRTNNLRTQLVGWLQTLHNQIDNTEQVNRHHHIDENMLDEMSLDELHNPQGNLNVRY